MFGNADAAFVSSPQLLELSGAASPSACVISASKCATRRPASARSCTTITRRARAGWLIGRKGITSTTGARVATDIARPLRPEADIAAGASWAQFAAVSKKTTATPSKPKGNDATFPGTCRSWRHD
jgi:hypothetical protein